MRDNSLSRSAATREAILNAARARFATDGYERATIRAIAADAGIDPALVMRYFGNKERLFAAAAQFDLRLPDLRAVPRAQLGEALAGHFFDRWEGDEAIQVLLRAGVTNEAAAKRLRAIFATQVRAAVARIVPDRTEAGMRAVLVSSQVLGFALARHVLEFPPAVAMSRAEVVRWIGPTLQRYLAEAP